MDPKPPIQLAPPTFAAGVREQIVLRAEELLADARAGKLDYLMLVCSPADSESTIVWQSGCPDVPRTIYELELLKHALMHRADDKVE